MWATIFGLLHGFMPVVIVLTGICLLYYGVDPPKDRQYDAHGTFCKRLDKKIKLYDQDVRYLITYMNIVLPLMSVYTVLMLIDAIKGNRVIIFFILASILAIQVLNFFTVRGIDKLGFYLNLFTVIITGAIVPIINYPGSFIPFVDYIIAALYIIPHIIYFAKRYDLFAKTTKQLREEYE